MEWMAAPDAWLARWLFTRALGAVYAIAFVNVLLEFRPLLGTDGLTPVPRFLARSSFRRSPSLFFAHYSDAFAMWLAAGGLVLSLALFTGLPQQGPVWLHALAWLLLWSLYQSYVNVGQIWYAFGWESILLEAGFFAAFLGSDTVAPTWAGILMVRWLLFRVELGAGLIKLRGDPCWRDLTCLEYHHETQPIPAPFSWRAHHLPRWWHRVEVAGNHVTQLVVPFLLFLPGPVAAVGGVAVIVTQAWLVATGNFAWLNAVTMVLAVTALSNSWLSWLPVDAPTGGGAAPPMWWVLMVALVALAVVAASWLPVRNMLSSRQRMNASFNPLHLVGTYGAFGSITRRRHELVIEGTSDASPGPDSVWREYDFRGKPGLPGDRPRQIAPYHLRLDWLMWFAAMSPPSARHGWLLALVEHLLAGDRRVTRLLRRDPFAGDAPAVVRIRRYRYRFTTPAERRETGDWWVREAAGTHLPPVRRRGDGGLVRVDLDVWPPAG